MILFASKFSSVCDNYIKHFLKEPSHQPVFVVRKYYDIMTEVIGDMKYQSGQVVQGIVTGIKPYGAFVKIDDNTDGLIHISEISDNYVNDVSLFVRQGE